MGSDTKRASEYYKPHTREVVKRKHGVPQDDKWFHNVFIRQGLAGVKKASGYASDHNVFLEGAKRSSFGDEHSIEDSFVTKFEREDHPLGVTVAFTIDDLPFRVKGSWVDAKLVGVLPTVGQTIEDRYGKAIKVDADLNGRKRTQPTPGPLADLKRGRNTIVWSAKPSSRQSGDQGR
jgi:hypothetical protein